MTILIFYLIIINFLLFIMMCIDKKKAIHGKWRISENKLFLVAFLGGALGGLLGMYIFKHKTNHFKFIIGFPVILIINFIILYWSLIP